MPMFPPWGRSRISLGRRDPYCEPSLCRVPVGRDSGNGAHFGRVAVLVATIAIIVALVESLTVPVARSNPRPVALASQIQSPSDLDSAAFSLSAGGAGWEASAEGTVTAVGGARTYGSLTFQPNMPIVGMAATPDRRGYWLVAADGGVFSFGDAQFYGSTGAIHLNQPIVGMAPSHDGRGYWMVAADGGVFSFGDAPFYGSMGSIHLNQPIVGITPTPDGQRLLDGRIGRRHLQPRGRRLLRVPGGNPPERTHRRFGLHPGRTRLLDGRIGRGHIQRRRCGLLRIDRRQAIDSRIIGVVPRSGAAATP